MEKIITNTVISVETEKVANVGVLIRKTVSPANQLSKVAVVLVEALVFYTEGAFLTHTEVGSYLENEFFSRTLKPDYVGDEVKELNLVIQRKGVNGIIESDIVSEVDNKTIELKELFNFVPLTEEDIAKFESGELKNLSRLHGKDTETMDILVEFTQSTVLYS